MNKMIVIINESEDCMECPLLHYRYTSFKCGLNNERMRQIDFTKRPDWCPLKSIKLKKKKIKGMVDYNYDSGLKHGFVDGWNAYFDEIINT